MNDAEVYLFHQTPKKCAIDLMQFVPLVEGDKVLEPFKGEGAFYDAFPDFVEKDWCEITAGRDYKDYEGEFDWVVSNPPFRLENADGKRVNAFWTLLDFYTARARKGVAFFANDACMCTLTPRRLAILKGRGFMLTKLVVASVKKWRGRYFLMVFQKDVPTCVEYLSENY
jgi:hypothetical protein